MKTKLFSLLVVGCILGGCALDVEPEIEVEAVGEKPVAFALEDDSGNQLGYAIALEPNLLVAPDHLWQVSESLYYEGKAIEVLARDFRHDLIFFRVPGLKLDSLPTWSNKPPGVGQELQWEREGIASAAPVLSARAEFVIGNTEVQDLMQLSVATDPGSSGLSLFGKETHYIYGMLVATDAVKDVSYFVRSDVVLNLAEEYLLLEGGISPLSS